MPYTEHNKEIQHGKNNNNNNKEMRENNFYNVKGKKGYIHYGWTHYQFPIDLITIYLPHSRKNANFHIFSCDASSDIVL